MKRKGDWQQTFTGKQFWPLDPKVEEIDVVDIAWSLSNQCRFVGHTSRFYCPTPDQRILTTDLRWICAGDLSVGTKIVGFDEYPIDFGSSGKRRRRFRPAVVLSINPIKRKIIRLEMEDGSSVRCSSEHPWLIATKGSRNQKWVSSKKISDDIKCGKKKYMHKFLNVWGEDNTKDGGWLAGICDGEGSLAFEGRGGTQFVPVSQRPGLILDKSEVLMKKFEFRYSRKNMKYSDTQYLTLLGGWREMMRFLGFIRPYRFLDKFTNGFLSGNFAKQLDGIGSPSCIIKAYPEKEDFVIGIETDTHTYLCEGYAAHNSVAEHSVWVSRYCYQYPLEGLLHDAAESYLSDIPRPLKPFLNGFEKIEEDLLEVIFQRFKLIWPVPVSVKRVDTAILQDEQEQLMPFPLEGWHQTTEPALGIKQRLGVSSKQSFYDFIERFKRLSGAMW